MTIIKKTCGFLVLLGLLLGLSIGTVYAADPTCTSDSLDAATKNVMNVPDGSYIVTVLNEPISAFDEVLVDENGITISQIFLKYKCAYSADGTTGGWDPDAANGSGWSEDAVEVEEGSSDWMYTPYPAECPTGAICSYVQVLIGTSGTGLLKTYIAILYRWAASIVGIIAVLVIVISGIQISADQGSGESVGSAKTRIMQSLAGLVILFLSALILYTINPTFFN